jgi:hypothetical protein
MTDADDELREMRPSAAENRILLRRTPRYGYPPERAPPDNSIVVFHTTTAFTPSTRCGPLLKLGFACTQTAVHKKKDNASALGKTTANTIHVFISSSIHR